MNDKKQTPNCVLCTIPNCNKADLCGGGRMTDLGFAKRQEELTSNDKSTKLEEQLLDYFSEGAPSYTSANEAVKSKAVSVVNDLMQLITTTQAEAVREARIDELQKVPLAKLDEPDNHKSQKYRDAGKFLTLVYFPKRIAQLTNTKDADNA